MERNWLQAAFTALLIIGAAPLFAETSSEDTAENAIVTQGKARAAGLVAGTEAVAAKMSLNVEVINVQSDVGSLYISVYDSKESFLGTEWFEHKVLKVAEHLQGESIAFDLQLPAGEYAIAIHHDNNDNKKMDTNFIGIPKEPVAMSNKHIPRFGPPQYEKAKFLLEGEPLSMQFKL